MNQFSQTQIGQVRSMSDAFDRMINFVENNNVSELKNLLESETEIDINKPTPKGKTALICASEKGFVDSVKVLIQYPNCNINLGDSNGYTALHQSALNGHVNVIRELVTRSDTDINVQERDGMSPLHIACREGSLECVKILLHHEKCNVNLRDSCWYTALHYAVSKQDTAIINELLAHPDIDVNIREESQMTPLHIATRDVYQDYTKTLIPLLRSGKCDVNMLDADEGFTPLHYAVSNSNLEMMAELLAYPSIDVNVKDDFAYGDTALHEAVRKGWCRMHLKRRNLYTI